MPLEGSSIKIITRFKGCRGQIDVVMVGNHDKRFVGVANDEQQLQKVCMPYK